MEKEIFKIMGKHGRKCIIIPSGFSHTINSTSDLHSQNVEIICGETMNGESVYEFINHNDSPVFIKLTKN